MCEMPSVVKRVRKNFAKMQKIVEIPNLISMQRESYKRFLQMDVQSEKREDIGLQAVFKSVFPIKDFTGSASLEFVSYSLGGLKHSVSECIQKGMNYEVAVRITVRLVVYDIDKETSVSSIRDIKEQEVYFGTIPLMTFDKGTFIINGTERVVVSQLHRSSGVFFDHDKGKTHSSGRVIYSARVIPVRGSWIDMEIDPKGIVYLRIDRRRKFPVTILFKALGYSKEDLFEYFYQTEKIVLSEEKIYKKINPDLIRGQRSSIAIIDPATEEVLLKKGRIFTKRVIKQFETANIDMIQVSNEDIYNRVFAHAIIDSAAGNLIANAGDVLDEEMFLKLVDLGIKKFDLLYIDEVRGSDSIKKTLMLDKVETKGEALIEIYRRLRPGNPPTQEVAQDFVDNLFFKHSYYNLSGVGRMKINHRLGIDIPNNVTTLRKEDILLTTKTLIDLRDTQGAIDDIDHLGNRRVRAVGELLENQYRIGLVRMERAIKERMSLQEVDALMPNDLVNSKPVSAVVKEFFGTSQLSQFMDQTNPLSETTHKRRLSALGPGGLTRERAGFEVRDVHPSHYGRICPIETPEGPNIGLIVSLSTYAQVNQFGFVETPYRIVENSRVTKDLKSLSAFEEKEHPIAQANAAYDETGEFSNPYVTSRVAGEFMMVKKEEIELMDVSPNQLVSVSASLIPFLENDDANRALMGSNMQRQAVPLLKSEAPLVGTGIEGVVAKDSGVTVLTKHDGVVLDVDASRIIIKNKEENENEVADLSVYSLSKFIRSNQNTCFNHRTIVQKGQEVNAGEIIADGPSTERGELALGKNILVAFMPWGGYNFEDSILVSDRLVKEGTYTSVHIEEFEVVSRDTKLGREEITRDIPNVGDDALKNLDESGIVELGAEVKPGDILAGKITPKGETQLSPEEKLLRAIFGEKAGDVKDTSLKVPPGVDGTVIDVKIFSRKGVDKDARMRKIDDMGISVLKGNKEDILAIYKKDVKKKVEKLLIGKICLSDLIEDNQLVIAKDTVVDSTSLSDISVDILDEIVLSDPEITHKVHDLIKSYKKKCELCSDSFEKQVQKFDRGDDLPPGVIKMVKIYVALKRKLSVGDKMAGRHGNKGVISQILPQEDMPYFEDGRSIDMVLNPLGVPSRMNVGQILEIHLGFAAKALGEQLNEMLNKVAKEDDGKRKLDLENIRDKLKRIFPAEVHDAINAYTDDQVFNFVEYYQKGVHMATPVFDGAKEEEIKSLLKEAGVSESAQTFLYDGRTGEPFREKITVGMMYMLKLHHLVDDKIHARSIGPYSLVTQQPLGGKAQFGGQRLGEMEVWAMEAYGAAHALQEFLTVKSDDMAGRTRMYEKIIKGQNTLEPGIPESFRVLTKELQSLGLDINLMKETR